MGRRQQTNVSWSAVQHELARIDAAKIELDELALEFFDLESSPDAEPARLALAWSFLTGCQQRQQVDWLRAKQIVHTALELARQCGSSRVEAEMAAACMWTSAIFGHYEDAYELGAAAFAKKGEVTPWLRSAFARLCIRLGRVRHALFALNSAPVSLAVDPFYRELRQTSYRYLGRFELSAMAQETQGEAQEDGEHLGLAWERVASDVVRFGRVRSVAELTRRGRKLNSPEYQALAFLLVYATADRDGARLLQRPRNILRGVNSQVEPQSAVYRLVKVAQRIDEFDQAPERIDGISGIFDKIDDLEALDHVLLALAAVAWVCHRHGQHGLAQAAMARYRGLSLSASEGISVDCWNCINELDQHYFESTSLSADVQSADLDASNVRRYLRVTKMSSQVGAQLLKNRMRQAFSHKRNHDKIIQETKIVCAEILRQNFRQLRGAWAKVAQLGSLMESHFPEEVRSALRDLCLDMQPMTSVQVNSIFEAELGAGPDQVFTQWIPAPFAAGSIGQVHRAIGENGEPLAVKVKYERIEAAIKADFRAMKSLSWMITSIYPAVDMTSILKVWRDSMLEECNYHMERERLERHRKIFEGTDIIVPAVHGSYCSQSVLSMDYMSGLSLEELMMDGLRADRERVAEQLVRSALHSEEAGLFRYDFHPGNYAIVDENLVMLDFGAVIPSGQDGGLSFTGFIDAVRASDRDTFGSYLRTHGWIVDEAKFDLEGSFRVHQEVYLKPFMTDKFHFSREFAKQVFESMTRHDPNIRAMTIPPQRIYLLRFYWSLYSILGQLDVEVPTRAILESKKRVGRQAS